MTKSKTAHYRLEAVAKLKLAEKGSVDLDEFAAEFTNHGTIQTLRMDIETCINGAGISPEKLRKLAELSNKLAYECSRAVFPILYASRLGMIGFGSARTPEGTPEYENTRAIFRGITSVIKANVITGAADCGDMGAATIGAKEGLALRKARGEIAKGHALGISITLPFEETNHPDLDFTQDHGTFGSRLNSFADQSHASYSARGGGGTDLENGIMFQLRQIQHLESEYPVILDPFWEDIARQKFASMYEDRIEQGLVPTVSPEDLNIFEFIGHPDDVVKRVLLRHNQWYEDVRSKLTEESKKKYG